MTSELKYVKTIETKTPFDLQQHLKDMGLLEPKVILDKATRVEYKAWKPAYKGEEPPF